MSEGLTLDPWTPLFKGDYDPLSYEADGGWQRGTICEEPDPSGEFFCTRKREHMGLHVAAFANGRVCCNAWGRTRGQSLPEGF